MKDVVKISNPTLMQTGRITTHKPLNKFVEAGREGGVTLFMMRMGDSHVKMMTNAKQDDIPSCQFSYKTGRHISQTTTICRSTKQVDEGSMRLHVVQNEKKVAVM